MISTRHTCWLNPWHATAEPHDASEAFMDPTEVSKLSTLSSLALLLNNSLIKNLKIASEFLHSLIDKVF